MILAIDIGNTNIVIGGLSEHKAANGEEDVRFIARMATDHAKTEEEYAIGFNGILQLYHVENEKIQGSIISSVVPPLTNIVKNAVMKMTGQEPLIVGPGIKTGLNITLDNPGQMGSDLVADAVAAIAFYSLPAIVFDMGTGTTVSVIDKNANYLGGMILPGVAISLDALSSRASQLPRISLEPPKNIIGKNSIDCMKSGVIYGNASMIDGIIERIEEELGQKATAIATGGLAKSIVPHCKKDIICDDLLLLKGMLCIWRKNTAV